MEKITQLIEWLEEEYNLMEKEDTPLDTYLTTKKILAKAREIEAEGISLPEEKPAREHVYGNEGA